MFSENQQIGLNIFIFIAAICIFFFACFVILIKRQMDMKKEKSGYDSYIPCGKGLPKIFREKIEKALNASFAVTIDPIFLTPDYEKNFEKYSNDQKYSFLYRLRTLEDFKKLKEDYRKIDKSLNTYSLDHVQKILFEMQKSLGKSNLNKHNITSYVNLVRHARHSSKPFTKEDYQKFQAINQKIAKQIAKTIHENENHDHTLQTPSRKLREIVTSLLHSDHKTPSRSMNTPSESKPPRVDSSESDDSQAALILPDSTNKEYSVKIENGNIKENSPNKDESEL